MNNLPGMFPLVLLWVGGSALGAQQSPLPSMAQLPFITVWNAPTERCMSMYNVDLDLSIFHIVLNVNQSFMGKNITIFYENKLGHYPYYTDGGEAINGGVPQNNSLQQHLKDALANIMAYIPSPDFQGLSIVDWERWRPLWVRNWDTKQVYREGSRALVRAKHPAWTPAQVEAEAVKEFQKAGRAFMEGTLRLGRSVRPGGLWGFYGFPCCYNYEYKNVTFNYTGECPALDMKRNDQLAWLWNASSALYPHMYLDLCLRGRPDAIRQFARHRILEGMRAAAQVKPDGLPVLPYARIVYAYSMEFLSQEDLVHTIGESVALGAAGVVLWGDGNFSKTKAECLAVKGYLDQTLGSYVVNVTAAAIICSKVVCSDHGRCQRKDSSSAALLHLEPQDWRILSTPGPRGSPRYSVHGQPSRRATWRLVQQFKCLCYPGWGGERCEKPSYHSPH